MILYNESVAPCTDCGAEHGEEHSPKCAVVLDHEADATYEAMKNRR